MKKVLLTGATGFVGRHALPLLLERGFEVHAVSAREVTEQHEGNVNWHKADLLSAGSAAELLTEIRPSHLLHLAWYAVPGKFWNASENIRWVRASFDMLEEFVRVGGERVVMAGSCAEYDWRYGYCSEERTPLAPRTLYGACKHSLQTVLTAYAHRQGVSSAWGRIFFLYGPREHPDRLVAYIVRGLLRHERIGCTHGNQIRDFLYAGDAASAFVSLLESSVTGSVNVASGQPVAVKDLINLIAQKLNGKDLIDFGAVPLAAEEPPLLVADVSRLRQEVGWTPAYSLEEGLERTISWWTHNL